MNIFEDRIAVVTGGGDGIGAALSRELAARGARVAVVDIREEAAHAVADDIGTAAQAYACDISDRNAVATLAETVVQDFGAVHMLFANAGIGIASGFLAARERALDWIVGVNVTGTLDTLRAFYPHIETAEGERAMVVTASSASLMSPDGPLSAYGGSKHMSMGIAEALRAELAPTDIRAGVLCPGLVNTPIWDGAKARPDRFGGVRHAPVDAGKAWEAGMTADHVAKTALDGLAAGEFYLIVPDPRTRAGFDARSEAIAAAIDRVPPAGDTRE
ncbi:MAG: SDR family NAD(P)-dependent oxidoreductase [Pseudomonadota bacterium]